MNTTIIPAKKSQTQVRGPVFSLRLHNLRGSIIREILSHTDSVEMIAMAAGLPDDRFLSSLQFPAVDSALLQYGTSEGERDFRRVVAGHVSASGLNCQAQNVLATHGSQQGLDLVAKLFIDEETPVLTESPTYLAALQVFRFFGAKFHGLALSGEGICPDRLEWTIKKIRPRFVYLVPTFQNPSGICYTKTCRQEVAKVLSRHRIPLVEDDPYRIISFCKEAPRPIASFLPDDHPWIYLGSLSKTLAPGLRIGFLTSSHNLMPQLIQLKQSSDLHSNRIGQYWAAEFLKRPDFHDIIGRVRKLYAKKCKVLVEALKEYLGDEIDFQIPRGGYFIWGKLARKIRSDELLRRTLKMGVSFMPGNAFFPENGHHDQYIRLNFSNPETDKIREGVKILAQCYWSSTSRTIPGVSISGRITGSSVSGK